MEGKRKIMIIDDEADLCDLIKLSLEMTGAFEVAKCSDSKVAIGQVREHRPDLILLDVMMPGKDGPEIAAELEENSDTKDIPIVFLTALVSGKETRKESGVIGGRFFLPKPVKTNDLIGMIDSLTKKAPEIVHHIL
jgi:CheY-like chemotaxis protein